MTKKSGCTCEHTYQDGKYGDGVRVFNSSTKKVGVDKTTYRCTVCNKEKAL